MKAELKPRPHLNIPGATVFEVWYDGQKIAEVTGADEPGVRIVSHHPVTMEQERVEVPTRGSVIISTVRIRPTVLWTPGMPV